PVAQTLDSVLVSFRPRARAHAFERLLMHRGGARSLTAMAALLAHEVKNPLSGIRGAAQLLDRSLAGEDLALTRLIREETDRICALVDAMEVFDDGFPPAREPVNIHRVLTHVRRIAENGFARRARIIERYDPSLPPVYANREQLIQVFLNLVKNAAEAAPDSNAEIILSTAYHHGVRLARPGGNIRVQLPIAVTVQDNGGGVPEDMRAHLFDPFITSKSGGSGLGLALAAKIVGDHGGAIEYDSVARRTLFRVMLPTESAGAKPGEESGEENGQAHG
ncbi:MAG: two-component system sensor histidine kinase NtrB, partial [Alphaproteobacteria bacterium]